MRDHWSRIRTSRLLGRAEVIHAGRCVWHSREAPARHHPGDRRASRRNLQRKLTYGCRHMVVDFSVYRHYTGPLHDAANQNSYSALSWHNPGLRSIIMVHAAPGRVWLHFADLDQKMWTRSGCNCIAVPMQVATITQYPVTIEIPPRRLCCCGFSWHGLIMILPAQQPIAGQCSLRCGGGRPRKRPSWGWVDCGTAPRLRQVTRSRMIDYFRLPCQTHRKTYI